VIVAAVGQTILTTPGMLSGWITSIVSVSAPLMGPEDRMVDWVTGTRFQDKWVAGPSGAAIFWRATSLLLDLLILGSSSPPIAFMINPQAVYRPSSVGNSSVAKSFEELRVVPLPQAACRKTARTRSRW
jgi:hypothetical protein